MLETYDAPTFATAKPYTPEYAAIFKEWCKAHNAFYYGRPKADFNIHEARLSAMEVGATILLLDNMS